MPLKIGKHRYFNTQIEVLPVRTLMKGLCYKLYFGRHLKTFTIADRDHIEIFVTSNYEGMADKLKGIHVTLAENNTWQGIIEKKWPYSKIPSGFMGSFSPEVFNTYIVELEENFFSYREGESDFDECMKENETSQCVSIFDPRCKENQ